MSDFNKYLDEAKELYAEVKGTDEGRALKILEYAERDVQNMVARLGQAKGHIEEVEKAEAEKADTMEVETADFPSAEDEPTAKELVRDNTRAELDEIAEAGGIDSSEHSNKEELADAIVEKATEEG